MSATNGDPHTQKVLAAFRQMGAQVIEQAQRTHTPIIVWEDGRVVERTVVGKKAPRQASQESAAELFHKWKGWIGKELLREFQQLVEFQHINAQFNESLKPLVGTSPEWFELVEWMSVNAVGNLALAIRRLVDKDKRALSLYWLLKDVKDHVEVITPENLEKYRGPIGNKGLIEDVPGSLERDMELIARKSDPVRVLVDKLIEHSDRDIANITLPNHGQLLEAVRVLHDVYRKWALFLAGMPCQLDGPNPDDLLPCDPPDYQSWFEKMWGSLSDI